MTTSLGGERRFAAAVARRLQSLGKPLWPRQRGNGNLILIFFRRTKLALPGIKTSTNLGGHGTGKTEFGSYFFQTGKTQGILF